MKKTLSMIVIAASSFGFMASSHAATGSKADYDAAKAHAKAEYKTAHDACNSLKDNAKDICQKEAKAARVKTEAEAEANYKGTAKAHKK
ncbi:MAG TPA: hypothetical protein VGO72_07965, partial [Herminiimonas sp.]|nr:hypothetical protein [Herminiimonas sp.]